MTTILIVWNFVLSIAIIVLVYLYIRNLVRLTDDHIFIDQLDRVVYLDSRHEDNIKAKLEDSDEINS